jgi:hypothetical protein
MEIQMKRIKNSNWVKGEIFNGQYNQFKYEAQVFDEGSMHGIEEGKVSKLEVKAFNPYSGWYNVIANYDRGWDIYPDDKYEDVVMSLVGYLEEAY